MNDDEEESLPDEEEPPVLREKWEREESEEKLPDPAMKICPSCGRPVRADSFSCFYCGERVFWNSGLLGRLASWFSRSGIILVLCAILVLLGMALLF